MSTEINTLNFILAYALHNIKDKNVEKKNKEINPIIPAQNSEFEIWIGDTVDNILPTKIMFYNEYDDPGLVIRDLWAPEDQRGQGGGGKNIGDIVKNHIKENNEKISEEEDDLEFIKKNLNSQEGDIDIAIKKVLKNTKKNIETLRNEIKEDYSNIKRINKIKLIYMNFLNKESNKRENIKKNFIQILKKMFSENNGLQSETEFNNFEKKILKIKNKIKN
jgi:hypothetical protein